MLLLSNTSQPTDSRLRSGLWQKRPVVRYLIQLLSVYLDFFPALG
jgi:hypothetical protein